MKSSLDHLSLRIRNLLAVHGVTTVDQIADMYPHKLLGMRSFGFKALRKIEAILPNHPYFAQISSKRPMRCICPHCQRAK